MNFGKLNTTYLKIINITNKNFKYYDFKSYFTRIFKRKFKR